MDRRGAEKSREMMLEELLGYDRITIQCHDNPDADTIACGFGVYLYLKSKGKEPRLIYGGQNVIRKPDFPLYICTICTQTSNNITI